MERKIKIVSDFTLEIDEYDEAMTAEEIREEVRAAKDYIREFISKIDGQIINAVEIKVN